MQGSETTVLAGASGLLPRVQGLLVEMSLVELYEGQKLFTQTYAEIADLGFELWDLWPGYRNPQDCRLYQVDALFFHSTPGPLGFEKNSAKDEQPA